MTAEWRHVLWCVVLAVVSNKVKAGTRAHITYPSPILSTEVSHGYERTAASYHTQESSRLRNASRLARGLGSFVKAFEGHEI